MTIKIDVDYDLADNITRASLVDMYETTKAELKDLKRLRKEQGELPPHKKEDRRDAKSVKKALERVIRYVSTKEDLKKYGLEHLCRW